MILANLYSLQRFSVRSLLKWWYHLLSRYNSLRIFLRDKFYVRAPNIRVLRLAIDKARNNAQLCDQRCIWWVRWHLTTMELILEASKIRVNESLRFSLIRDVLLMMIEKYQSLNKSWKLLIFGVFLNYNEDFAYWFQQSLLLIYLYL